MYEVSCTTTLSDVLSRIKFCSLSTDQGTHSNNS